MGGSPEEPCLTTGDSVPFCVSAAALHDWLVVHLVFVAGVCGL